MTYTVYDLCDCLFIDAYLRAGRCHHRRWGGCRWSVVVRSADTDVITAAAAAAAATATAAAAAAAAVVARSAEWLAVWVAAAAVMLSQSSDSTSTCAAGSTLDVQPQIAPQPLSRNLGISCVIIHAIVEVVVFHKGMLYRAGSSVFKFVLHAVVSVVIAIAVFCIVFLFADHPAALATVAFRIRV
jgi:hypothetical protein